MPTKKDRTNSVVISFRVWPDVEAGFRELAESSGLSYAGLLARALELLRADPALEELAAAYKQYDETFERIVGSKARKKASKA